MGLLEEVGSPFMLEGHSHWAPSSVWRKELPSCLLWQNLPEDSDTIAHLAPCFLSFFFFPSYWNFPPSRHDCVFPAFWHVSNETQLTKATACSTDLLKGPGLCEDTDTDTQSHLLIHMRLRDPPVQTPHPDGSSWKGDELEEEKALPLWDMLHECRGLAGGPECQRGWQIPEIVRCLSDHPLG